MAVVVCCCDRLQASVLSVRLRFALLRLLNLRLSRVVPLLDVMNASDVYSLGFKLRCLNHCVFVDIKGHFLQVSRRFIAKLVALHCIALHICVFVGLVWACLGLWCDRAVCRGQHMGIPVQWHVRLP